MNSDWEFGRLCPDCGAPYTQFCALCGADLFSKEHGKVDVGPPEQKQAVVICVDCVEHLARGEKPPFSHHHGARDMKPQGRAAYRRATR